MKKIGMILIIIGLVGPIILLMFFGENWFPAGNVGIVSSIIHSELVFVENTDKNEDTTKINMPDWGEDNPTENEMSDFEEYNFKISITFRYVLGLGLVSILLGSIILIKEFNL